MRLARFIMTSTTGSQSLHLTGGATAQIGGGAKRTYVARARRRTLWERARLPPPGPEHFAARRLLWLMPPSSEKPPRTPMKERPPSSGMTKLQALLSRPGVAESDEAWEAGLKHVWKLLDKGTSLKQTMPLSQAVQVLHAGWLRNGTWPRGDAVVDGEPEPLPSPVF